MDWAGFDTRSTAGAGVQDRNGTCKAISLYGFYRANRRARHIDTLLTDGLGKLARFSAFLDLDASRFGIDGAEVLQRANGFTGTASLTCPRVCQYFYDTWNHVVTTSFKGLKLRIKFLIWSYSRHKT